MHLHRPHWHAPRKQLLPGAFGDERQKLTRKKAHKLTHEAHRVGADEEAGEVREVAGEAVGRRLEVALVAGEVDERDDLGGARDVVV